MMGATAEPVIVIMVLVLAVASVTTQLKLPRAVGRNSQATSTGARSKLSTLNGNGFAVTIVNAAQVGPGVGVIDSSTSGRAVLVLNERWIVASAVDPAGTFVKSTAGLTPTEACAWLAQPNDTNSAINPSQRRCI
jgi:hypothetical protein